MLLIRMSSCRCGRVHETCAIFFKGEVSPNNNVDWMNRKPFWCQVKMSEVIMSEIKMSEVKMSVVKMSEVIMSEVKMSEVKMSEVIMSEVKMSEVIMSELKISEVKMSEVIMSEVKMPTLPTEILFKLLILYSVIIYLINMVGFFLYTPKQKQT